MGDESRTNQTTTAPFWEKAVAAIGLAVVTMAIGYLTWLALSELETPPRITLEVKEVHKQPNGYLAQVEVSNQGAQTVADLLIEGRLESSDGQTETAEAQLDYVPSHSMRQAGLFFRNDPEKHPLTLQAKGYQEP